MDAPTNKDSAITSWPGNAQVNKLDAALCCKLKPASFNKAPKAIKHAAKGMAGDLEPFKDFNP